MADGDIRVLGISGSLRKGSYNSAALRAAGTLMPAGMSLETADISGLPLYDEDVREQGYPAAVEKLRAQIAAADAVLFATPEYNYSVPGVLKNAIDWVSRPPDPPMNEKPVAILGASISLFGSARAQYHLRQILVFLNAFPINRPEVMIPQAASRFDDTGKLTDETSRKLIAQQMEALAQWVRRLAS